jgi:uncharacterized protein
MPTTPGRFHWYELLTSDPDGAQAFYGTVVGWDVTPSGTPGADYRLFTPPGDMPVAGLMQQPGAMPGGPMWLGYVSVDDAATATEAAEQAGAHAHMRCMEVPEVGTFSMLTDPQGTPFYLIRGSREASESFQMLAVAKPGHCVWNELTAPDPDAAVSFYTGLFGWRQEGAMPMGELGDYRFIQDGQDTIGAVMGMSPKGRTGWQFYFLVDDIDAATARVTAAGGAAIQGPDQIPGGSFSLVAEDPQGARFGLVGPRRG